MYASLDDDLVGVEGPNTRGSKRRSDEDDDLWRPEGEPKS